jgi:hypothetical protein
MAQVLGELGAKVIVQMAMADKDAMRLGGRLGYSSGQ